VTVTLRGAPFAILALILGCATTRFASQPYYQQTQVDVGITRSVDTVSYAGTSSASGTGLRLTENNGLITKSILTSAVIFLMELSEGASRTKSSSSYSTEERARGYECRSTAGGRQCVATGWQSVTTRNVTVTVRPRTPEEQAAHEANLKSTGGLLAVIPMHTDIAYYPQRDNGDLWGYSASSYFIAVPATRFLELASGYYFQRFTARVVDETSGMQVTRKHRGRGIHGELFLNQLAFDEKATGERTHGARLSAAIALPWMQRLYARLGIERNRLGEDGAWGTTVEIGARF
jgi:hypothetical protein